MDLVSNKQKGLNEKESIILENYQITLPDFIRKCANLKIGEVLHWDYDEQTGVIFVIKKPKNEVVTIKQENFGISFRIIKNPWEINKKLNTTVPIAEDFEFIMEYYYRRRGDFKHLDIPEILGVLMKLYGDPDNFYDDYKCSFNYTFDLEVTFKEDNFREETINLVMRVYDYKGVPCIQFRRPKENENDNEIKFIDDIVKREHLNAATIVINNYFYGFFEGYGDNLYDEFERIQPYIRLKYGYKNGKFFSEELPSE